MLQAAKGLVRTQFQDITDDPELIINEFRTRFYDSGLFRDKYAGGKFAEYLFIRHDDKNRNFSKDNARHLLEETQLFIEAAHACNLKILESSAQQKPAIKQSLATN